ncbi:MAG: nuclear transport factor 2 family protein [Gammaproteobacteria bacterium]|nr:nuclear transport factor 2 family protein [Gammaproteobacteria bacterium]
MADPAFTQAIADEESVRALIDRALEITQSDNFAPYFDLFTDDAHWMMPSSFEDVGVEEAKSFYRFTKKFRFEQTTRVDEVLLSGDLAFARISLDGYLKTKNDPDATPLRSISRHIWIIQRQVDGEWKITHDIWNNPKAK